ncbi:MAG: bacteriohopanetetrol glucosamine biosynthesis glycosyltransferase HpnI [Bryobacteraceae bacterium]
MRWLWGIPAALAGAYYLVALAAGLARMRRPKRRPAFTPPVSILKPVRGRDPRFQEAIRSHAIQRYPDFEILFGVADPADPAVADVQRLQREFPDRAIRLVVCPTRAANGKVGVLADLAVEARHPYLLVNDSDILVEPDYLTTVMAPLQDSEAGLVTCLYRASGDSLPSRFEGLGIATEFAPSVLVARFAGVSGFALGSTMAFRVSDLQRIGGFSALADYLADDYELGARISALGYCVELSDAVVETNLSGATWGEVWRHQLRWSRTIRASRTAGYYGYLVTQASAWAVVAAFAGQWWAVACAMAPRLATGLLVGWGVLRDRNVVSRWYLMPVRDLWGFAVWVAGLAGSSVEWRGIKLRLGSDGKIVPF